MIIILIIIYHEQNEVRKPAKDEGPDNNAELCGSFLLLGEDLALVGVGGAGLGRPGAPEHGAQQRPHTHAAEAGVAGGQGLAVLVAESVVASRPGTTLRHKSSKVCKSPEEPTIKTDGWRTDLVMLPLQTAAVSLCLDL